MQIITERVEEPVRGRDHPVMTALALHHGQPPVSDLHIPQTAAPSTSHRRSPASSMPSTIARSRSVRSAPTRQSASCGDKILGRVRGTRTKGTVRDRTDPPCRRVSSPAAPG
jgi:hypothetical protein